MDACVSLLESKLEACCANVPLFVPVASDDSVDAGDHHVMSDIEFPSIVQKWSV